MGASRRAMRELAERIAKVNEAQDELQARTEEYASAEARLQRAQARYDNTLASYREALAELIEEENPPVPG